MTFAYCGECEHEVGYPTDEQCVRGEVHCHNCDEPYLLTKDYPQDVLIQLLERVNKIEQWLAMQEDKE